MDCPKCKSINVDSRRECKVCGYKFFKSAGDTSGKKQGVSKQNTKVGSVYSWAIIPAEIEYQVDNYETLKFSKTFCGAAVITTAMLMLYELVFSIVLSGRGVFVTFPIVFLPLYLIAFYFAYKRRRWAFVLLMVLVIASFGGSALLYKRIDSVILMILLLIYYYKALLVESTRHKTNQQALV